MLTVIMISSIILIYKKGRYIPMGQLELEQENMTTPAGVSF